MSQYAHTTLALAAQTTEPADTDHLLSEADVAFREWQNEIAARLTAEER